MKGRTGSLETIIPVVLGIFRFSKKSWDRQRVSKFPQMVSVLHPPLWQTWLNHQTCLNQPATCSAAGALGKSQASRHQLYQVMTGTNNGSSDLHRHCLCASVEGGWSQLDEIHQKPCAKKEHEREKRIVMVCRGDANDFWDRRGLDTEKKWEVERGRKARHQLAAWSFWSK